MWRPAHGATSRPGPCRPAGGYGRALGRPGPRDDGAASDELAVGMSGASIAGDLVGLVDTTAPVALDPEVEAPTPVTP
jgi:hypothetical protein